MELVIDMDDMSLYEFRPTFFKLLAVPLEKLRFVRRMRLLLEYIRGGYKVYYLAKKGDIVGYCVVTPGGRRLKSTTKQDGVIGPYYIHPKNRGLGLSKSLINMVLTIQKGQYDNLYAWVEKSNTPSIRCLEACGFVPIGRLDVVGPIRKLVINPNGVDIIYRKTK